MSQKILFVTHQLTRTGAPQVLFNMVLCCQELGHAVMVISLSDGDARKEWEQKGIDVTVMPQLPQVGEQMIPIFKKFDVIFVNTLVCLDVIKICIEAKVKSYWWIHEHENYFRHYGEKLPKEKEFGENVRVLAVSPLTGKLIRQYAGYNNVELLPFSVPDHGSIEIDRSGDHKDIIRFICVGVYAFVKGQDILCTAIDLLTEDERKRCCFDFYGDRSEVDRMVYGPVEKAACKYSEVNIYDTVPHESMLDRMKQADYLIIPSRKEPMPTVAVEAMMLGRPCIISDICGVTDWLENGKNALFFKAERADELAERIRNAINMDETVYSNLARSGRAIYEKEFSEDVFRERIAYIMERE